MEEISTTIPKYQPLRVLWHSFMHPHLTNDHFQPDSLVTRELVPLLFEESLAQSSSKSVQPVFIPFTKKFLLDSRFFLSFFLLSFMFITCFSWACGSLCEPQKFYIQSTFTCLFNNLLISSWISAKFVPALLPCMYALPVILFSD